MTLVTSFASSLGAINTDIGEHCVSWIAGVGTRFEVDVRSYAEHLFGRWTSGLHTASEGTQRVRDLTRRFPGRFGAHAGSRKAQRPRNAALRGEKVQQKIERPVFVIRVEVDVANRQSVFDLDRHCRR